MVMLEFPERVIIGAVVSLGSELLEPHALRAEARDIAINVLLNFIYYP